MKGTISVIIPVYNVQEYLNQSIDSVLNQSYSDLQIIIVDDGSTDKSSDICDYYAKKDSRIIVVHQENGGAANAKNTGLRLATGQYLDFLDGDDYLEQDAYTFMVEQLNKHKADMIQCCFRNVYVNKTEDRFSFTNEAEFGVVSYLRLYTQDWTCGLLWDKLYRREIFEGLFFEEGHKIDDEFFTYKGVMNATKIIRNPRIVYNYRKRRSSVMSSTDSQKIIVMDKLEYLNTRRKIIMDQFPELKKEFDEHYLNMLLILSQDYYVSLESLSFIKKLIKEYFHEPQKIHIPFGIRRRLFYLTHRKEEELLKEKTMEKEKHNLCFYYK